MARIFLPYDVNPQEGIRSMPAPAIPNTRTTPTCTEAPGLVLEVKLPRSMSAIRQLHSRIEKTQDVGKQQNDQIAEPKQTANHAAATIRTWHVAHAPTETGL